MADKPLYYGSSSKSPLYYGADRPAYGGTSNRAMYYGAGAYGGGFQRPGAAKNDGKRVLICPYCKEKLRVPVGAGTIKINCPHCHQQFEETV